MENKDFELSISNGCVVAPSHPAFFDGRFVLEIKNNEGYVELERNGYTLNEKAIEEIKSFVKKKLRKLKSLSKKKRKPWEGGGASSIVLKYGDINLSLSCYARKKAHNKLLNVFETLVKKTIEEKNAVTDEKSPDPVKFAEEWTLSHSNNKIERC